MMTLIACGQIEGSMEMMNPAGDPASIAIINVASMGAVGDCATDDTKAIQAAVATAAMHGGGTVFVPKGCYLINAVPQGIALESNISLRLDDGAIFQTITNDAIAYSLIQIANKTNVNISGGVLIGDRTTHTGTGGEWGFGISILSSSHVTIEDVVTRDFWGDGIYVGQLTGKDNPPAKDIVLRGCVADNNRRQGLSLISVSGAVIDDCTFRNTHGTAPEAGVDLEPNLNNTVENVLIKNCLFDKNTQGVQLAGGAGWIHRNQILNNRMTNNTRDGIHIDHADVNNYFSNNIIQGNQDNGLYVAYANSNFFTENSIQDNGHNGIIIGRSSNNVFSKNYISGNAVSKISILFGSKYNYVQGNICQKGTGMNMTQYGIHIGPDELDGTACQSNMIISNDLKNSGDKMLLYDQGKNTVLLDNEL